MRVLDEPVQRQPAAVRLAFLEVLHYVVFVDGHADASEERLLDELCVRLDLEELRGQLPERAEWRRGWAELLQPIARHVLVHAALMAVADGRVHGAERVTLERLALALGCDTQCIEPLLVWAMEGRRWAERGLELTHRVAEG